LLPSEWYLLPIVQGWYVCEHVINEETNATDACVRNHKLMEVVLGKVSMVASKCSQNRFISEKYKAVQSFKEHFFQDSPLVQP
jgi:hypothetical protein